MRVRRSRRAFSSLSTPIPKLISPLQLNHLLQICSNSQALDKGRRVHQQIILRGLGHDHFMVTKLVQMYAGCDDFRSAHVLFDELSQPNVFAWTAILAFYSRNGMPRECIWTYGEMQLKGIVPDNYVFPKVLRACAQSLSLEAGIRVHRDVIMFGSEFNIQVCNSLIDMYAKCGDVWRGRRVFDMMVKRDLLSWNSMISGYVCNGFHRLAVELLNSMILEGVEPDLVTWNTVMDAYCRIGLCDEAWKIFEQIKEPNIISWTTLISGYSRIEKHEISLGVFREMMNKGVVFPDLDSLCSVVASSRHLGALRSGQEIHAYGIKTKIGSLFYDLAGAALLTMYAKARRIRDARNVFELMDKNDVVTWNAMILGFVDAGFGDQAVECFCKVQRLGIKNDQITISTVLPVCNLKYGREIHAYIMRYNFDLVIMVWNALIHMYSKCGCVGAAHSVFYNMKAKDLVSWNTMIGGLGMHGLGRAAIQLLQEMIHSGFSPNYVTFTSILSACSHSGLVNEGLELLNSMTRDYGFAPKMEHFACIVDLLARAGRLEDAVDFIKRMPLEPDKSIWGTMLAASRDQQNVIVGKLAAEHLFHLEREHAGNYVTLSNLYARAGRWDDAVGVRKLMEGRGLAKPSGYSWIESRN
ncbi:pentatricopeptide repeat-containing protein At3g09040, mitochondrial-like [Malania oleifera]|uniref:pentatricopeptide repeat-containing protein At3g09040, mitochondrial-like n=1 Tax=Malania oleifera TaxID=397392 RepID=UPI0025AE8DE3|nr:pentatricopeptide repeat-containing protein At3g09040, mitochondrial-like [Malania oleifera]